MPRRAFAAISTHAPLPANGRLSDYQPLAIVDIGSNSVRLVVYEGLNRSPTPLFNEKVLCGLGKGVAETGRLSDGAMAMAYAALRRFRLLCRQLVCSDIHPFATAAVREAENGAAFVAEAGRLIGVPVRLLSGEEEARLTALGIISGVSRPKGLVGDLGGGSLELVSVSGDAISGMSSHPLGALRLRDLSGGDIVRAREIVAKTLAGVDLPDLKGQRFYAVGGTWRAFARVHMATVDYPIHVVQGYRIKAKHAAALCRQLEKSGLENLPGHSDISPARSELLPFGAVVMAELIRRTGVHAIIMSALGVREGFLYTLLPDAVRERDPLMSAVVQLAVLRARSPDHARELCAWSDAVHSLIDPEETDDQRRIRHAACWLSDIGWRVQPDYSGEQSVNIITHAALTGISHAERAILAMTVFYRHARLGDEEPGPGLRHLTNLQGVQRAALCGAALRVAFQLSAAMPGVLPQVGIEATPNTLRLVLPAALADLDSPRVRNRLDRLARLVGVQGEVVADA